MSKDETPDEPLTCRTDDPAQGAPAKGPLSSPACEAAADDAGASRQNNGPAVSRRAFFGAGVSCAAMIGLGGFGVLSGEKDKAFVRPPGAAGNRELLSACNRCDKCVQACPYGIIQPAPLSHGVATYATPVLDFSLGRCDFCMKCTEACPTEALSADAPGARDVGVAVIVSDACIAWDWSGCTVCFDECPVEGAITIDEYGRPVVHPDYCDGCGTCENKCPSSSLRSYNAQAHDKGIVIVSRASAAAAKGGAVTTAQLNDMRLAPSQGEPLAPHSRGVHLDGPDNTRKAGE